MLEAPITLPFGVEYIVLYFLLELFLPLLLFVVFLFVFLFIQSKIVLHAYYKLILPVYRQNKIIYWLFGGTAVASHEILGHALVGAATGSDTTMAGELTPESGQVKIMHRQTAWGYLSAILATLAPCFAPPALLLLVFTLIFPSALSFQAVDLYSILLQTANNFLAILETLVNSDLTNPLTVVFFYLLTVLSTTSGASKVDFQIVLTHTAKYWYFALFLLLAFSAGLELARAFLNLPSALPLLILISSFLALTFLTVLVGVALSLAFAAFLKLLEGLPVYIKLVSALAFPVSYLTLLYLPLSFPLPFYFSILALSLFALAAWTAFLRLAFYSLKARFPSSKPSGFKRKRLKIKSLREYEESED